MQQIVYNLTLFRLRYMQIAELEYRQKLRGFPEDKNYNRSKVLIRKFHKKLLKRFPKRQSLSGNRDSWIANLNPIKAK